MHKLNDKRRVATRDELNICSTLRGCSGTVGTVDVLVVVEECGFAALPSYCS